MTADGVRITAAEHRGLSAEERGVFEVDPNDHEDVGGLLFTLSICDRPIRALSTQSAVIRG